MQKSYKNQSIAHSGQIYLDVAKVLLALCRLLFILQVYFKS